VGAFLRACYWRARRKPADALHMLGVLPGLAGNALRLLGRSRRAGRRRPVLAIALVEHMGDIVAAEPIARLARTAHPGASVLWVARAPYATVPTGFAAAVDAVLTVRCLTEWLLLRRLGLIDIVWDLHLNGRICPRCCVPLVKPGRPDLGDYLHHGSLLQAQCLAAGLPPLRAGPVLRPPAAAVRAVDALALPRHFVAVHCVSSDPQRDWPAENWQALLARLLLRPDLAVVEVGLRPMAILAEGPRQRSLCGRLAPLETAEAIRRAALFIGVDSGPAHLANAVGTPGVVLLGRLFGFPRYVPFSGDYADGTRATLLHAEGRVADLTVDDVSAAIMARLRVPAFERQSLGSSL
jgi:ADP-heptose:LPS heptosyltransferase